MALTKEQKNYRERTRRAFRRRYGDNTHKVIQGIIQGKTTQQMATLFDMSKASVATTKGNFTRGLYSRYIAAYA